MKENKIKDATVAWKMEVGFKFKKQLLYSMNNLTQ